MDNNSMYNELDSMKAQMNLLKEKLERQEIVKEQHLRKAIKGKLDEINRTAVRMIFIGLFAAIYCLWMQHYYGYSVYMQAATLVMLLVCTAATYLQHKNLLKAKELSADLIKETYDLVKLRRQYARWLWFAVPVVLLWLLAMSYETLYVIPMRGIGLSLMIGMAVGAVIGGIIGLKIHFRTLGKIDAMLAQIRELTEEN